MLESVRYHSLESGSILGLKINTFCIERDSVAPEGLINLNLKEKKHKLSNVSKYSHFPGACVCKYTI